MQRSSSPVRALTCLLIAGYAVTFFFGFSQVGAELTIRRQDDTKAHNRGIHEVLAASGSIVLILSCGASSAFFVKADLKCSSSVFVTVSQFVLAVALFILGLILPFMVKRRYEAVLLPLHTEKDKSTIKYSVKERDRGKSLLSGA